MCSPPLRNWTRCCEHHPKRPGTQGAGGWLPAVGRHAGPLPTTAAPWSVARPGGRACAVRAIHRQRLCLAEIRAAGGADRTRHPGSAGRRRTGQRSRDANTTGTFSAGPRPWCDASDRIPSSATRRPRRVRAGVIGSVASRGSRWPSIRLRGNCPGRPALGSTSRAGGRSRSDGGLHRIGARRRRAGTLARRARRTADVAAVHGSWNRRRLRPRARNGDFRPWAVRSRADHRRRRPRGARAGRDGASRVSGRGTRFSRRRLIALTHSPRCAAGPPPASLSPAALNPAATHPPRFRTAGRRGRCPPSPPPPADPPRRCGSPIGSTRRYRQGV